MSVLASVKPIKAANYGVNMTDSLTFAPSTLTVAPGDSVTWTSISAYLHTTTSGNGSSGTPNGLWDSGVLGTSGTFTLDGTATSTLGPGTYSYYCSYHYFYGMTGSLTISTPVVNVPPSISLTNPADGAKYLAPASVALAATATNGTGNITNVQFFNGVSLLGNAGSAPFSLTLSNLAAGNYSFTSVAQDDTGQSGTSAAVNVYVLTNSVLFAPRSLTNAQFQLTISGIAGQTYITEISSDLKNWTPFSTNVAPADVFSIPDSSPTNTANLFYRVRQDLF